MNKIFSAIISSPLKGRLGGVLLALLTTTTLWAYDFQSGDLYYNITSSSAPYTVEVTYQEYSWSNYANLITATIPETVTHNGTTYSVTKIGKCAFENCSALTFVTIPNSVTSIGVLAFAYCDALTSVTIPNSVTSIGNRAFAYCDALTSVTIPNCVTSIGDYAFEGCRFTKDNFINQSTLDTEANNYWGATIIIGSEINGLIIRNDTIIDCRENVTSVTIPNSVTSIGDYAFSSCSSLTSITIPNSVTSIGDWAFGYCSALTSVTIGNSVTSIGVWAFYGCSALTSIVVESGNSTYDSRENCNAIIETATNTLVVGCKNTIIPNSVTSIGRGAFYGCSFTSVTIPNSVTSIGDMAFSYCRSLTSVTIPNSVTSIGGSAFYSCSSLSSVTIGNSVTSIGVDAFKETEVYNNKSNWKNDVLYISNCLIEAKTTLSGAYTINDNTQLIGSRAFANCRSLTSIIIPNSVKGIGNEAFGGCWYITSLTIPNSVTNIGYGITAACPSLISIVVENGNMIYDSRENCNAIIETTTNLLIAGCQNTIIPNSITGIGDLAFHACFTLTSITIPNSVTSIGREVFVFCESLTTVICKAIEVPKLGSNVFKDMPLSGATLYVRAQSLDDYKAADQWKDFGTILPTEEEEPEDKIELQDTEITIVFTNSEDNDSEIYSQSLTIKVPTAPEIEGFTFLGWQPVATLITDTITIQAIYEANTPTSAEVYTNPANPTQKLLRNGQIYILQDGKTYTITGQRL